MRPHDAPINLRAERLGASHRVRVRVGLPAANRASGSNREPNRQRRHRTAVVATVGSYRTLGIDHLSFGISALIPYDRSQSAASSTADHGERPTVWPVSADGIRIVFGTRAVPPCRPPG